MHLQRCFIVHSFLLQGRSDYSLDHESLLLTLHSMFTAVYFNYHEMLELGEFVANGMGLHDSNHTQ